MSDLAGRLPDPVRRRPAPPDPAQEAPSRPGRGPRLRRRRRKRAAPPPAPPPSNPACAGPRGCACGNGGVPAGRRLHGAAGAAPQHSGTGGGHRGRALRAGSVWQDAPPASWLAPPPAGTLAPSRTPSEAGHGPPRPAATGCQRPAPLRKSSAPMTDGDSGSTPARHRDRGPAS